MPWRVSDLARNHSNGWAHRLKLGGMSMLAVTVAPVPEIESGALDGARPRSGVRCRPATGAAFPHPAERRAGQSPVGGHEEPSSRPLCADPRRCRLAPSTQTERHIMTIDTTQQAGAGTRLAIQAGGLIGAIGAGASIAGIVFMSDLSQREGARSPLHFTANVLIAVGFLITALALAGSSAELGMPRWAVLLSAAGCAMVAAVAWGLATFGVETARLVTDKQWEHPGVMLVVAFVPKMILCAIGFGAFAIVGWRTRTWSRGACILPATPARRTGQRPRPGLGGAVGVHP